MTECAVSSLESSSLPSRWVRLVAHSITTNVTGPLLLWLFPDAVDGLVALQPNDGHHLEGIPGDVDCVEDMSRTAKSQ